MRVRIFGARDACARSLGRGSISKVIALAGLSCALALGLLALAPVALAKAAHPASHHARTRSHQTRIFVVPEIGARHRPYATPRRLAQRYAGPNVSGGPITVNGAPVSAAISTPNTAETFTFSGTAGEIVTVSAYGGTFPGGCDASVSIEGAGGVPLSASACAGQNGFIGETLLPGSGTYTLILSPNNSNTGTVTLALSGNPANASITVNGPPVTFTATHTGQGQVLLFTGSAGEVVNLSAYGGTFPSNCDVGLALVNASTSYTVLAANSCASSSQFIGGITLPGSGTYVLVAYPVGNNIGSNTGSLTLAVTSNVATKSIAINGSPATFTTTLTGQGGALTFTGTAGQVVNVSTYGGTFPFSCDEGLSVTDVSTRTTLATNNCASSSVFLPGITLPASGTYQLNLYPEGYNIGSNTGSVTLAVTSNLANGSITINGSPVTFTASKTGQGQAFAFTATAGQVLTATSSGGTFPNNGCDESWDIVAVASSSVIANGGCATNSATIAGFTIPASGTYTINIFPQGNDIGSNTGSLTVNLT